MYVTRRLSVFRKSPEALSCLPPDGPNSGILVIQDEEVEQISCLGLEYNDLKLLPFPQNVKLELYYRAGISVNRATHFHHVAFIPVLGEPLSSNKYYVIQQNEKHRGEAYTSSKEEDFQMDSCCFYSSVSDLPLQHLDISNAYQQVEIFPKRSTITLRSGFSAKSVAPDGVPPKFLTRRWRVSATTSSESSFGEAAGIDDALRAGLPEFNFSLARKSSDSVVVGKWYCPFMFIKEGSKTLREEIRKTMFYEMTLEQKWEQIFSCENDGMEGNRVMVNAGVEKEVVVVADREAVHKQIDISEGLMWFRSYNNVGTEASVGLSTAIVERMKWEQERSGWIEGKEKEVRVERVEELKGNSGWKKFGCYVLVESFVLKRLDGSLVLTYSFRHTHQIRTKWE
ncbi:hypothetical protein L6164_001826 [Bauhinia variegata]|uniref:Uncharacterized protein n=2 Tax=Bauhinia variegata TaxID=167791 RepID=A0ACB9QC70_BAUVA|nr:hypothetical protein L6164_001826 [Bauhinia variegata]